MNSGETKLAVSPPLSPEEVSEIALNYVVALGEIEERFFAHAQGLQCARDRSRLIDGLVQSVYERVFGDADLAVCAIGGYGRGELYPYSDIDLLILSPRPPQEESVQAIRTFIQLLWDAHARVSQTVRTVEDCGALHEGNTEFTISLLDLRPLAGSMRLADEVKDTVLPRIIRRERSGLLRQLGALIAERHAKFSDTVYHLEPNVKDAPGALRDLQSLAWWRTFAETQTKLLDAGERWPDEHRVNLTAAHQFLTTLRTYLHYTHGRDVNIFTYDIQQRLAAEARWGRAPENARWGRAPENASWGQAPEDARWGGAPRSAESWMRDYFGHARFVKRRLARQIDASSARRNTLFRAVLQRRNQTATPDFSINGGEVYFRNPRFVVQNPRLLVDIFKFAAERKLPLSDSAERAVIDNAAFARKWFAESADTWPIVRDILLSRNAYEALAAMHDATLLTALMPEWEAIDCLVIRDFYHRYSVDEHTLLTIRFIAGLRKDNRYERFAELYNELEYPEALLCALLLHDIGKGLPGDDHVASGMAPLNAVLHRWRVPDEVSEAVRFLVAHHLALSRALRRDIFDSGNVDRVAALVGSDERLKMLTLMTLADVHAVNPDALTPWKEDSLWQLYVTTYNHLTRGVDRDRIAPEQESTLALARNLLQSGVTATAEVSSNAPEPQVHALARFLEGLPRRYLATHTPADVLYHCGLAARLARLGARVRMRKHRDHYELTVIAWDRPQLFATVTGVLSAQGANILKAEAFANAEGIIVDTFRFVDLHRTLELNTGEAERFVRAVEERVQQPPDLERLRAPAHRWFARPSGPAVPTRIAFEEAPTGSTIVDIIARDRPGLLFDISRVLAVNGCDISVALIDTEANRAIDVFYVTAQGQNLREEHRQRLKAELMASI